MPLPEGFPEKKLLEEQEPPYESVEDVQEATDEELLGIDGIDGEKLKRIRAVAPYKPSPDEQGSGQTSGATTTGQPPPESPVVTTTGAAADPANNPNTASDVTRTDSPTIPTKPGGGGVSTAAEQEVVKGEPPPNSVKDPALPEGVHKNERGTFTASSSSDQPDIVSSEQAEAQRRTAIDQLRNKMRQVFDV